MRFQTIGRYLTTLSYLRKKQIKYQLLRRLKWKRLISLEQFPEPMINELCVTGCASKSNSTYFGHGKFNFLNVETEFSKVDWNYMGNGLLWTYNLNYFDFLHETTLDLEGGMHLMREFCDSYNNITHGKDSYPTSLRILNWVFFIVRHKIKDSKILDVLNQDLIRLSKNLEYHLLGNHLLENAFAVVIGSFFFKNKKLMIIGEKLLYKELEEQIDSDGAHYELSPMYHSLILGRLLHVINFVEANNLKIDIREYILLKASEMLGWLEQVTFANNSIPMINDCAHDIAPATKDLALYAKELGIKSKRLRLKNYRKVRTNGFELLMDVANIIPSYQPGHAHADSLNFILHVQMSPFIVDTGTSTYERSERRALERSTVAHNTVVIGPYNSSDVWAGFRVGRRARIINLVEGKDYLKAAHDGYRTLNCTHSRRWQWDSNTLFIDDMIVGRELEASAHFHFHPSINLWKVSPYSISSNLANLVFQGANEVKIESYEYATGFNRLSRAKKIIVNFSSSLTTKIDLNL